MRNIRKLFEKLILSTILTLLTFLTLFTLSTIFAKNAHAGPQGFGWVAYQSIGGVSCTSSTSRIVARLYTENGSLLSGGSITINGVTRASGGDFGCMTTSGGFYVSASLSGYQPFSSAFSFASNVVTAGQNHVINVAIYLTNTRTIEIISPTSGNFPTSPVSFQLYTRRLPYTGCSSATVWAIVDGSYMVVDNSAGFGTITVPVSMSNATHSVAFAFGENCGVLPVSAVTGAVTITVGGRPDLIITALSTNKTTYLPGETVTVSMEIKNQGNAPASAADGQFSTTYRSDFQPGCSPPTGGPNGFVTGTLAAGAFDSFAAGDKGKTFTAPSTPGQYTLWAMTDVNCEVNEGSNEGNNTRTTKYTVAAPAAPTCTITASPRSINAGDATTISWTLSPSAVSGNLYKWDTPGPYILIQVNIPTTGSIVENPILRTIYKVEVRDISGQIGQCTTSVEILDVEPPPEPPPGPTGLRSSCDGTTLNFAWEPSPGANGYRIQVDDLANGWANPPLPGDSLDIITATSFSRTGESGHTYEWQVWAANEVGASSPTAGGQVTCPLIDTLTLIPNQCENAAETEKLTDNYITKPGVLEPPIEPLDGVSVTGTLNSQVTIPLSVQFTVDFSKLQALFGYPTSDYLEGRFQEPSHRDENILELSGVDFNNFHGAAQKAEPKYLSDLEKVKYVHYVYNKPQIAESANKYTDIKGLEPKTIKELVDKYGFPTPPTSGDRSWWLATWGPYWPKIPTAYNELYKGKLEFAVIGSQKSFEDLISGNGCASASARTVEFIVPDFGRTTLVADQLNQVVVPYAAQSFRDHRTQAQGVGLGTPKNFLAKAVDFCKKIITAPVDLVRGLQKVIKVTLDFLTPLKTAYAQENDGPTCIKVLRPGKEGNAPYCGVPPSQIQPGDSCSGKIAANKLDTQNLANDVCTFQIGSFTTTISPQNPFWDECRDNGDGTYTCTVAKIRVYPNFRLPWIAEIWNSTLYSDANEAGLGSVQGAKTDEKGQVLQGQTATGIGSPQVTGRPGIYQAFIPKVLYQKFEEDKYAELGRLHDACPNFPKTEGGDEAACAELWSATFTCLGLNLNDIFDLAVALTMDLQDIINQIAECVASEVGKNLSGQAAEGGGSVQGVKSGEGEVLAETTGESGARERFVGAVDCGKYFARDVSLKPKALQKYLGIGVTCSLETAAIPSTEIPPAPPPPGGSGELAYYIKYGDTSILPADRDAIIALANNSWPDNNTDQWDFVVSQSIARGISPAFTISIWWEEGGFGGILQGGGRANSEFGCFPGGDTSQQLDFDTSFNCFLDFTANEHPYSSSDPYGSFYEWVDYFCGPNAPTLCSKNPGFIDRLESIYNSVAPGEIVYVPG